VKDTDVGVCASLAYHLDEPFGDPSSLPTYYVCREARRHVTVCLSGDGGDETFAGYTRYREALKYEWYDRVPAGVRRAAGGLLLATLPRRAWGRGAVERFRSSGPGRYLAQMGEFSLAERRALLAGHGAGIICETARCYEPIFRAADGADVVSVLQHVDQKNYLPDDILVKVDRMSMQNSLEVRAPLLDHEVVEAINAAPVDLKIRRGRGKYLLREILEPHVPRELLVRRKHGFGIPIRKWFHGGLNSYAADCLLGPGSRADGHMERAAIRRILSDHAAGMRDFSRKIWSLLMFEHWCRAYGF